MDGIAKPDVGQRNDVTNLYLHRHIS